MNLASSESLPHDDARSFQTRIGVGEAKSQAVGATLTAAEEAPGKQDAFDRTALRSPDWLRRREHQAFV
jgi:hypothetical protein